MKDTKKSKKKKKKKKTKGALHTFYLATNCSFAYDVNKLFKILKFVNLITGTPLFSSLQLSTNFSCAPLLDLCLNA